MTVTLNISSSIVRVLSAKGRQVKMWESLPLAAGLVRDGLILQPKAVGEAINSLFKTNKIPGEKVIASVTALSFTYRFLSLPRVKPALMEETIRRATRKEIPLPLDELYLSWQPVNSHENETTFFVVGTPRNLVDTLRQTLTVAGLEPYIMDLRPLALARAARRDEAIIVNLDNDCFDIVLVSGGIPVIMHTISPRADGTLEDNIQRLADELLKTVAYYESQHPESRLSPAATLLLAGEMFADAASSALIQAGTGYPVEPLVPPLEYPPDLPAAAFAVNMGLALKKMPQKAPAQMGTGFHDININLLSAKHRSTKARAIITRQSLFYAVIIVFISLLFPLYQARSQFAAENAQRQTELQSIEHDLNLARLAGEESIKNEETVREITAAAENQKETLQVLLRARGTFASSIMHVTGSLPPQTGLASIDIDNTGITLRGETDNPFTVVSYATSLEKIEAFSEIRIKTIDEARIVINTENGQIEKNAITFDIMINK